MAQRGRKKREAATIQTAIRLEPWLVGAIDAEILKIAKSSGVMVTRSSIMRAWLEESAARRNFSDRLKLTPSENEFQAVYMKPDPTSGEPPSFAELKKVFNRVYKKRK